MINKNAIQIIKITLYLYCIFFFVFSPKVVAVEADLTTIVIVTGNYPPAINEAEKDKGYIARLVSDAFALEGINAEFLFVPWVRGLEIVARGKQVCVMYYTKNTERLKSFIFSDAIFAEQWLFFHLKTTKFEWEKLTDLSRFRVGATLSFSYSEEFNDLADSQQLNVHWVTRDKQNWHMLMAGRIDMFPNVKSSWHQLQSLYSKEALDLVTTHPKPLKTQLNYLLFSKEHPQAKYFKVKFNQGFAKLKKLRPMSYYIPDSNGNDWPDEKN